MKHCLAAVAIAVAASTSAADEDIYAWKQWVDEDRMTGEQEILGVKSIVRRPLDSLPYPYQGTGGQLLILCNRAAGFRFVDATGQTGPELLESDTHQYNVFQIRVRFDDEDVELLTVTTLELERKFSSFA